MIRVDVISNHKTNFQDVELKRGKIRKNFALASIETKYYSNNIELAVGLNGYTLLKDRVGVDIFIDDCDGAIKELHRINQEIMDNIVRDLRA